MKLAPELLFCYRVQRFCNWRNFLPEIDPFLLSFARFDEQLFFPEIGERLDVLSADKKRFNLLDQSDQVDQISLRRKKSSGRKLAYPALEFVFFE